MIIYLAVWPNWLVEHVPFVCILWESQTKIADYFSMFQPQVPLMQKLYFVQEKNKECWQEMGVVSCYIEVGDSVVSAWDGRVRI